MVLLLFSHVRNLCCKGKETTALTQQFSFLVRVPRHCRRGSPPSPCVPELFLWAPAAGTGAASCRVLRSEPTKTPCQPRALPPSFQPRGSARAGLVPSDSACVWGRGHGRGSERRHHRDGSQVRDRSPCPPPAVSSPRFCQAADKGCFWASLLLYWLSNGEHPCAVCAVQHQTLPLPRHPHLAPAPIFLPVGTPSSHPLPCCWSGTSPAPPSARLRPVPRC